MDSPRPQSQAQQRTNVEQGFQQTSRVDQSYQYASHVHPSEPAFSQQQLTIYPQSSTSQAQSAQFTAQLALVEHDRQERLKLIQQQQLQKGQHSQEETEQQLRKEHLQRDQQIQRDQIQRDQQTLRDQQAQRDLQKQRVQQAQREKDQQWAVENARRLASIVQGPTSLPLLPDPRASSPAHLVQAKPPTPEAKKPQAHLYLPKPATPQATSSIPQATSRTALQSTQSSQAPRARPDSLAPNVHRAIQTHLAPQAAREPQVPSRTATPVIGASNAPQSTQAPQAPQARPDPHDPKAPRPIQTHPASQAFQAHQAQPVTGLAAGEIPDCFEFLAELQRNDTTRFNAYMSEFARKQQPPTQAPQAPQTTQALQLPVHIPIAQPSAIPSRTEIPQPAPQQQQQKGLQKAPQPQQAPRTPQTPLWPRNSTPQPPILGKVLQAQLGVPAPPPKQLLSAEDAGVLAGAVISYLKLQGVTVSIGKVRDLLQSAADFDIMCAYLDTLGHSCDRPKLAKYMIAALEQAKKERQKPSVPASMKAPNPQPLGKAEHHPQRQPTPMAVYQQVPYGTLPGHSPVTQADQTGGSIRPGNTLGAVRGRGRFQGNPTAVVTPTGQPKRDLPTKREGPAAHPPPPPLPPPVAAVPTPPKDIVVIADSPSPPATPRRLDIDSHSPSKDGGRMHNNGAAPPGPATMSLSKAPIPVNRDAPSVETPTGGQTGRMQGPQFAQPLVETISRKKAVRVSQYDPATIARDILIIAGKHPTERGLNDHLLPLRDSMGLVWNSDLSTVRWDLIDPSPILLDDGDGDDEMDGGEGVALLMLAVSKKRARIHARRSAPGGQATGIAVTPNSNGSKNAVPAPHTTPSHRVSARREVNLAAQPIIADSRPPFPTTPMGSEKPPKRRRTDAANAFTPSNAPKKFLVFHCKWEGCDAELHNLELLKRHLMATHRTKSPHDNRFTCSWLQCARPPTRKQKSMEGGQISMRYDFASEEEWQAHVDGHTEAVRQTLGWGPAVSQSGSFHFLPSNNRAY